MAEIRTTDQPIFRRIQEILKEEHQLFQQGQKGKVGDAQRQRLGSAGAAG